MHTRPSGTCLSASLCCVFIRNFLQSASSLPHFQAHDACCPGYPHEGCGRGPGVRNRQRRTPDNGSDHSTSASSVENCIVPFFACRLNLVTRRGLVTVSASPSLNYTLLIILGSIQRSIYVGVLRLKWMETVDSSCSVFRTPPRGRRRLQTLP